MALPYKQMARALQIRQTMTEGASDLLGKSPNIRFRSALELWLVCRQIFLHYFKRRPVNKIQLKQPLLLKMMTLLLGVMERNSTSSISDEEMKYFYDGLIFYNHQIAKYPIGARNALEMRVKFHPESMWAWHSLASTYFRLGDVENVKKVYMRHISARDKLAEKLGFDTQNKRYFGTTYTYAIGHICILGIYAKLAKLEGEGGVKNVLYINPEKAANPCLLNYLRPMFEVLSDIGDAGNLEQDIHALEDPWLMMRLNGHWEYFYDGYSQIEERRDIEKCEPLIRLSSDDLDHGWQQLNKVGVPKNAWFVALHVRETAHGEVRNAKIDDYLLAIEAITSRGGWVIRLGDSTMTPLPSMDRVVDYAHSEIKSDRMDIFLIGACAFFVATNSGPAAVPGLFGKPCLQTNFAPILHNAPSSRDMLLPMLFRSRQDGKLLKFRNYLSSPIAHAEFPTAIAGCDVAEVPNTPEDILAAVEEMLGLHIEKDASFSGESEHQDKFKNLCKELNVNIRPRMSSRFLVRHADLLD